ncbi:serine/threonine-protein kinase [Salirhabdus euzebyi]|uniref:Serine/threonine-protein kinase n=1 Tax=Salirhabdus euzebyi TaxID=394506 RepID=A0A841Q9S9_9BACI|nr:protein kinase [Salirhabdus euzebyi]MBB6455261.1 serine/threonine-protein kinase [Salirhabdus euzebyi]
MRPSTKSLITNLKPGTKIKGKWHQHTYQIVKKLGNGAIGEVYLALCNQKYVALKISDMPSSITTEVNVLKAFGKVQGTRLGPSLLDVDDWVPFRSHSYSFYVMEYMRGHELNTFLRHKGPEWLGILMIQLLDDLDHLHREGWVFGDLKPENLIVTNSPPRLRWIDVGGTTKIGRAVKEYTEFYDRGYWGLGSRKADPKYDLFAVAMVMIQVYYPQRFEKGQHPTKTLKYKIIQQPALKKYATCLDKALLGKYTSSKEMKADISKILLARVQSPATKMKHSGDVKRSKQHASGNGSPTRWLESLGIAMVTVMLFVIFLILNMF